MFFVRLILRLVFVAVVFGLVGHFIPGIHVHEGFLSLLWLAILFTVVNVIVGHLLRLLSLPVIVLTLGLFLLVINAVLFALVAWLSSDLAVDNVGAAILGGFIVAAGAWIAELLFPFRRRHDHDHDHDHEHAH